MRFITHTRQSLEKIYLTKLVMMMPPLSPIMLLGTLEDAFLGKENTLAAKSCRLILNMFRVWRTKNLLAVLANCVA